MKPARQRRCVTAWFVIKKDPVDLFAQKKTYSVYELTSEIKRSLEGFGIVWVKGEISNFKHHSSGHMYFCLKDEKSQIKAACFRNSNLYLKFRPADGQEVLVRGRLSVYEPRGDYQIIAEYMEPVGVGSLQLAFEQLKERLRKEGMFEETHKVPLPLLPRKIGIITSPTGAAIRDMLRVLKRRNAGLHVLLFPAKVQGAGAAEEIAAGIRYFNTRSDIDVIIAGRGGGSIEDLWAFNEEVVARAIYDSVLPLISAVGHEIDFTIADFVADLRAPTPSAAAEVVSGAREDLLTTVESLQKRLLQAARYGIERRKSALGRLARVRAFSIAPNMLRDLQQRFDEAALRMNQQITRLVTNFRHREQVLHTRLTRVDLRQLIARRHDALARQHRALQSEMRSISDRSRARFELAAGRLHAMSPLSVLDRGYAICRDDQGHIVRDATAVSTGAEVQVSLARGGLRCKVEKVL
jgi:exodeoxyribonuclease VII large subunit